MTQPTTYLQRYRVHLAVVLANACFVALFVTIALSGFHQPAPHSLPVGIVAPEPVIQQLERGLDARMPGGFDVRPLTSESRARAEIGSHDIDAAVITSSRGFHLLTAEAGGTAPARAITGAFSELAAQTGRPLNTSDVVPPGNEDTQALSSFFVILCVLFPSLAAGIAAGHALRQSPLGARLSVLVAVAAIAGLAASAIGDGISELHHYWEIAGIVALFSLAISAPTAALGQIKPHLAAVCVLAFLVFGIPASGGPANLASFAPDFLRSLSSALPLGVAVTTVRNTVYFHAAATEGHLWVLTGFAVTGIAVLCLLVFVARQRAISDPRKGELAPLHPRQATG